VVPGQSQAGVAAFRAGVMRVIVRPPASLRSLSVTIRRSRISVAEPASGRGRRPPVIAAMPPTCHFSGRYTIFVKFI